MRFATKINSHAQCTDGALQGLANNISAFVTHPTKPRFVAAAEGGVVQTWDMLTHTLVGNFRLPTPTPITSMAFSHDGAILAIGGSMGVVRLCREADSELIADLRPVKQVTYSCCCCCC